MNTHSVATAVVALTFDFELMHESMLKPFDGRTLKQGNILLQSLS